MVVLLFLLINQFGCQSTQFLGLYRGIGKLWRLFLRLRNTPDSVIALGLRDPILGQIPPDQALGNTPFLGCFAHCYVVHKSIPFGAFQETATRTTLAVTRNTSNWNANIITTTQRIPAVR